MQELALIHRRVTECEACKGILPAQQIIPRSGFPPNGRYSAMLIGPEPGLKAHGRPTPQEYKRKFDPSLSGRNTVRRLFRTLSTGGFPFDSVFFTNAVKCPATHAESTKCFRNCCNFLHQQIEAVHPILLVVFGRATDRLDLGATRKDELRSTDYRGIPCLVLTHPQGTTRKYLSRVASAVKRIRKANEGS